MFTKNFALIQKLFLLSLLLCNLIDSFILPTSTQLKKLQGKFSTSSLSISSLQNSSKCKQYCLPMEEDSNKSKFEFPPSIDKVGVKFGALLTVYILNKNFFQSLPAFAYDSIPDKEVIEALEGSGSSSGVSNFGYLNFEIFDELARKPLKIPFFLLGAYVVFNSIEIFYLNIKSIFDNMGNKEDAAPPPGPTGPPPSTEEDNTSEQKNDEEN